MDAENQKRIHYKIWSPRLFYYNLSEPEKDTLQDLVSTVTTDVEKGVPELEKYSFWTFLQLKSVLKSQGSKTLRIRLEDDGLVAEGRTEQHSA